MNQNIWNSNKQEKIIGIQKHAAKVKKNMQFDVKNCNFKLIWTKKCLSKFENWDRFF